MDIISLILIPLEIALFPLFLTRIQLAGCFFEVDLEGSSPLVTHTFLTSNLPTIYQCLELCVLYKLCRYLSFDRGRGTCVLISDDIDRQRIWRTGYSVTTMKDVDIPQDIGGACRGHNCSIDEMCMQTGPTYTCVTHDYSTVKCPENWGRKDDVCLKMFFQNETRTDAENYCVSFGGELLMMESASELYYHRIWIQILMQSYARKSVLAGYIWTGIPYSTPLPGWIDVTSVATIGPNLCLALTYNKTGESGRTLEVRYWAVVSCDEKGYFICQQRAPDHWP